MLSEKQRTAFNLVAKIISYSASLLVSFFLTPYLVENLGKEVYSFYPLANNFVSYMSVITIALNSMASRFITIELTKKDTVNANKYFISVLFGNIIMSAILLFPMLFIVIFLDKMLVIPISLVIEVKLLFSLVFISMLVNLITNVFGVAVFSKNRLDLSSASEMIIGVTRILLYVLLFKMFEPTIVYVGIVSLTVAVISFAFQYAFTKKLLPEMKIRKKYFDWSKIKELLSSGIWNSLNQIGVVLLSSIGLLMCNRLYGAAEAADYAIALTIPQFVNGIVSMLASVFLPVLTIKYAKGDKHDVIKHIHLTQRVVGIIDNVPIAIFMAVGVNFFSIWTPSVDANKVQILSVLSLNYLIVTSVMHCVGNLNTVMNKVKVPAIVMIVTGVLNIVIIYILYKCTNLGVYGIPLSQMILFIVNRGVFIGIYSAHSLKVKWYTFYAALLKNIIGVAIIYVISYFVNKVINPQSWIPLIIECFVLLCIGIVLNIMIVYKPSEAVKQISGILCNFTHRNKKS